MVQRNTDGDPKPARDYLPLVYEELRRLARVHLEREKPGQTLQATALVHEAWIKIAAGGEQEFANRNHFFKAAAEAMRRILIDNARRKLAAKHGQGQQAEELDESRIIAPAPTEELLAVNDALNGLAAEEPEVADVVRLRYFVGMTIPETAGALDLSTSTVDRHWAFARAWLKRRIKRELGGRTA